jgi:hypothetical protein
MKLNIWPFSLSVGVVTAVASVICGILIALAPEATMAVVSYLFHIDLTGLSRTITWGGFFAGLVVSVLTMMLGAAATAWIYNCAAEA